MAAADPFNPNPNPNPNPIISAYYQTRAAHTGVVTSDWLAQAQAAVGRHSDDLPAPENDLKSPSGSGKTFSVINEFNNWRKQPDLAEAVAAIRALAAVIRASEATTMMELEIELKKASDSLKSWDTTSISLTAGCDLFMRYVTRTSALEYEDFNSAKSRLIERAEKFGEISCKARRIIAMLSQDFIFDGCTILVHGFSRVVLEVLKTAAQNKKLFRVFCTALAIWHIVYGVSDPLLLDTPSRFPRLRISENCPCIWSLLQKHTYLMLVSSPYICILGLDDNIL
uniref:Translation initiation factor eIF2B subunit alpha n=1 Tax=Fagus sylvatica TaxID=28930 RepID=A0A2N9G9B5_FAGSY